MADLNADNLRAAMAAMSPQQAGNALATFYPDPNAPPAGPPPAMPPPMVPAPVAAPPPVETDMVKAAQADLLAKQALSHSSPQPSLRDRVGANPFAEPWQNLPKDSWRKAAEQLNPDAGAAPKQAVFDTAADAKKQGATASAEFAPIVASMQPSVVPAHEVRRVSPETEHLYKQAVTDEGKAIEAKTAADLQVIEAEKQAAAQRASLIQQANQQRQEREAARQQTLDQYQNDQKAIMDDIRNFRIDPTQAYGTGAAGALSRTFSIIGVALGAAGASLTHGPNMALQIVNKTIDDSIDAQKAELNKKRGLLEDSRSLYAQKLQQFGDERVAEAATKADMLSAAEAYAQADLAGPKSEQQKAAGQAMLAKLGSDRAELQNKMFAWQGPTMGGGDPRLKRMQEIADKLLLSGKTVDDGSGGKRAMTSNDALAIAAHHVMGVGPAGGYGIAAAGSKGGGRQQALQAREVLLKDIIDGLKREKSMVQKGAHFSIKDANESASRLNWLPGAMAQAIDGSSSADKVDLYKEALSSPVGYTGAWAQEGRLASINELLRVAEGAHKGITGYLSEGGPAPAGDEGAEPLVTAKPLGADESEQE